MYIDCQCTSEKCGNNCKCNTDCKCPCKNKTDGHCAGNECTEKTAEN